MTNASGDMLKVGPFVFNVKTLAYQTMSRKDEWRWATVERLGKASAEQYIGPGSRTIELTGISFALYDAGRAVGDPGAVVGNRHIDGVRAAANKGTPLTVTTGRGESYGKWVIVSVSEDASVFLVNGSPKKQEFSISLRAYGGGGSQGFGGLLGLDNFGSLFSSLNAISAFSRVAGSNSIVPSEAITTALKEAGVL